MWENKSLNPTGVSGIGDPFVLHASDGKYYLYATSFFPADGKEGFNVWQSADLSDWGAPRQCYAADGRSFGYKDFWAPEVTERGGRFYMHYSARWKKNDSLRIGVAAVKGLCWGADLPAVGVSTLEAMAWHALGQPEGTVICCAMDARRGQLYNALFALRGGQPERLTPDRAISLEELAQEEKMRAGRTFVVGDGARLCYNGLRERGLAPVLAPPPLEHQSAWGVAMAAGDRPG